MITRALITLQDFQDRQYTECIDGVQTMADALNIAEFLAANSMAALKSVRWQEERIFEGDGSEGGAYDTVKQRLAVKMRSTENDWFVFDIPAPKDSVLEKDQTGKLAILSEIKTLLDTATGKDWQPITHGLKSFEP